MGIKARSRDRWIYAGIAAAIAVYFLVTEGFEPLFLLMVAALLLLLALLAEFRFRRDACVIFQDRHFEVSTYTWGARSWTKHDSVVIPYEAISEVDGRIRRSGSHSKGS